MSDPATFVALGSAGTAAVAITAVVGLRGWQEWLDLRRAQLDERRPLRRPGAPELTELRARVRRLEAIASGGEIDLGRR